MGALAHQINECAWVGIITHQPTVTKEGSAITDQVRRPRNYSKPACSRRRVNAFIELGDKNTFWKHLLLLSSENVTIPSTCQNTGIQDQHTQSKPFLLFYALLWRLISERKTKSQEYKNEALKKIYGPKRHEIKWAKYDTYRGYSRLMQVT